VIHLRNLHPKRTLAVPLDGVWCRLLRPGVTSMLPAETLRFPVIQRLIAEQLVAVVDAVQCCDADARQARAARLDMARLIAIAEKAEFDRLLQGLRVEPRRPPSGWPYTRRDLWPQEWTERLRQRWAEGATGPMIAAELGISRGAVGATVAREGLATRYTRRSNRRAAVR
jgi:hypothetical protein